jgi:flagellar biosynthesis/type III secretory pathway protein FliH
MTVRSGVSAAESAVSRVTAGADLKHLLTELYEAGYDNGFQDGYYDGLESAELTVEERQAHEEDLGLDVISLDPA